MMWWIRPTCRCQIVVNKTWKDQTPPKNFIAFKNGKIIFLANF